jgi:hypothetical protein
MMQTDPAIVQQLQHLVTTQTVMAISIAIIALAVLGVALGALFAIRKLTRTFDGTMHRLDPVFDTVEGINGRLKDGAQAIENRIKRFGTVVDVVQTETESLLLDAASTAHGVHTAAQMLRSGKRKVEEEPDV